jgi:uncharacterized protein
MDSSVFDRTKIYEKLTSGPAPVNYQGKLPWAVQQQIAATNGIHFKDAVGRLSEYPIPPIPVKAATGAELLLDIGSGWGRWLVAAARKNYLPIGIDLRLEFCEVSRLVLKENGFNGYSIVADLKKLPFQNNVIDVVWSFSVIQHTHYDRLLGCIGSIQRILRDQGYCYLEFPNKNGIHNRFGPAKKYKDTGNDYNSWDVRYYTPGEYNKIFRQFFDNFRYDNHSALGIGVLPGDIKYAKGVKSKMGILLSRSLSNLFEIVTPLKALSDSIYIKCSKTAPTTDQPDNTNPSISQHDNTTRATDKPDATAPAMNSLEEFWRQHRSNPENNLNIVKLLSCPATGEKVTLSPDGKEIISEKAKLAYPVKNDIPIMITGEARSL